MKKINLSLCLALATAMLVSSCYKKFDPKTYQPPLSIGGFTSTKEIQPSALVGYWAFDGSLIDSVSGQSGTAVGTGFSAGFKGSGSMQGANNGYVLFTPGAAITGMTSFTISYWVNTPVNANGIAGLVNLANTNQFWANIDMFFENGSTADAAKFRAHIMNNGGSPEHWISKDGLPAIFNHWTAMTISFDATTHVFKFYVNGNVITNETDAGFGTLHFTNSGKLVFGTVHFMTTPSQTSAHGSEPWASFMTGQLDEVRIYNKALSDAEVSALVKLEGRGK
jgi:hypothetical protein